MESLSVLLNDATIQTDPTADNIEERRRQELQLQRQGKVDYAELVQSLVRKRAHEEDEDEPTVGKKSRPSKWRASPFANQLMNAVSSRMPASLEDYYAVGCPPGVRCLVISSHGRTVARRRNGSILMKLETSLPAGNAKYSGNRKADYCILDCVYSMRLNKFFVLDVMCWRGHTFYDCDTEFRACWLRMKISEIEGDQFVPLEYVEPTRDMDFSSMDTLLIHKQTGYVCGDTALCVWIPKAI